MHFSTLLTIPLLFAAEGAQAAFRPRPEVAIAVPRAGLPYGGTAFSPYGRRDGLVKRKSHMSGMSAGAAAAGAGAGQTGGAEPTAGAKVQVVQVGGSNGSLEFAPNDIKAEVGSFVQFQFNPMNHSVVQSTFDAPCMPMSISMPNVTNAFFSGFMPAKAATNGTKLTYTIQVTDAKPLWFYCSQGKHCQAGMVGAINAASTGQKTLAGFKQLASVAAENLSPGQIPSAKSNATGSTGGSSSGSGSGSGTGAGAAGGAGASGTASGLPAQQTTNAGSRLSQSALGVVAIFGAAVALL